MKSYSTDLYLLLKIKILVLIGNRVYLYNIIYLPQCTSVGMYWLDCTRHGMYIANCYNVVTIYSKARIIIL